MKSERYEFVGLEKGGLFGKLCKWKEGWKAFLRSKESRISQDKPKSKRHLAKGIQLDHMESVQVSATYPARSSSG